jgi:hypothetical protein
LLVAPVSAAQLSSELRTWIAAAVDHDSTEEVASMSGIVTKAVAEIQPGDDDATEHGTFEVILSAPTKDRDGDTLRQDEWKTPLPDHITFDTDHGMSVLPPPSGPACRRSTTTATWSCAAPTRRSRSAQEVRTLVNEGHIRTTSVAFITEKVREGRRSTVRELLNGAFVAVPSNREAVVLSSKGLTPSRPRRRPGRRNSAADQEHAAGRARRARRGSARAAPARRAPPCTRIGIKSIVGSVEALQDRVSDALEDAYGAGTSTGGATCAASSPTAPGGGTVVFQSSAIGEDYATYSQTYTDDGAVVTLTGTAAEVDIHEIVVPDADADREQKSLDRLT